MPLSIQEVYKKGQQNKKKEEREEKHPKNPKTGGNPNILT
jgi:hypothetical protein